jgi:hypothetical protein
MSHPVPSAAELVARDLGNRLASEIASHALTRAQAEVDRAELSLLKAQLVELEKTVGKQKPPGKPRRR